jgi:Skp family chaperone for outer membrane proteins
MGPFAILFGITLILPLPMLGSTAASSPQKIRTLELAGVWKEWNDFQDWFLFVETCDIQNRKVLKIFEKDMKDAADKLETDRKAGNIVEQDYKTARLEISKRARELFAFQTVQDQITEYKIRTERSKRMNRIAAEVKSISESDKEAYTVVILDNSDVVAFNDKSMDISDQVVKTINERDVESLKLMAAEKQKAQPSEDTVPGATEAAQ